MFGIRVFGINKPRTFRMHSRYWDKEADEKELRKREILGDKYDPQNKEYQPGSIIREGQMRRLQHSRRTSGGARTTLIRSVIFLALAFAVLYVLVNYYGMVKQ